MRRQTRNSSSTAIFSLLWSRRAIVRAPQTQLDCHSFAEISNWCLFLSVIVGSHRTKSMILANGARKLDGRASEGNHAGEEIRGCLKS